MEKLKCKIFSVFLFCMISCISIHADIPEVLKDQESLKETKPIYSDRIISKQTGNFHDVLFKLIRLEKAYTYKQTLQFDVIAGAYEINIILACSDEFEINLSSNHHDFDFKPLFPAVEVPEVYLSSWQSSGRVTGIHDIGVYVYTMKGIASRNETYNVSLQYTPDHNGYPYSFYYTNENRGRPIRFLVDTWYIDERIGLQNREDFSTDFIVISTEPKAFSCSFWPSSRTQNNWNSTLYDISKKGDYIVETPKPSYNDPSYFGLTRNINPGIYKYHISVGSLSSSPWEMGANMSLYNSSEASEFYIPKVPFFNRTNYNPDDDEDDNEGQGKPIKFSYDDAGNRVERVINLTPQSYFAQDDRSIEPVPLLDKVSGRDIKIYPNPTYGHLVVELSSIEGIKNGQITILSFSGRVVLRKKIDAEYIDLDISSRPSGIYLMHIQIDEEVTTWKIIKQ